MSKADDWRTITRDGTDIRVRTAGSQSDQLATLAAGLKSAPSTNSI